MKLTKTELIKLIQEVVEESHTKADEEKLKKISKQLKKSTTMHKKQADDLDDIVDRSDDDELKEGVNNGKISRSYLSTVIKEEIQTVLESFEQDFLDSGDPRDYYSNAKTLGVMARPRLSVEELFVLFGNQLIEMYDKEATTEEGVPIHHLKYDLGREGIHNIMELIKNFDNNPHKEQAIFDIRQNDKGKYILVANNRFERVGLFEKKKKKPCKPAKGKRFAKRVNGKCRSFGQAGQAKGGGDRIRPGTKKGDAYCARSAKIKKCKNPPCANDLSRKKWKCRGSKSMKQIATIKSKNKV